MEIMKNIQFLLLISSGVRILMAGVTSVQLFLGHFDRWTEKILMLTHINIEKWILYYT